MKKKSFMKRVHQYHEEFLNKTIRQVQKARVLLFGIFLYTTIGLTLCLAFEVELFNRSANMGTVDMQVLLSEEASNLAKAYPNGNVPNEIMNKVVEEIKTTIQEYGKKHHLHLFAKGAILSGQSADYTPVFQKIFKDKLAGR